MYKNHIWELRIKKWIRKRSSSEYYLSSSENKAWKFQAIRDLNLWTLALPHLYLYCHHSGFYDQNTDRLHIYVWIKIDVVRSSLHKVIEIITIKNEFFLRFLSLRVYQLHCLRYVDNKSIVSFNFVLEIPILPHFLKRSFLSNNWPKRQLINEPVSLRNSSW